MKCWYPEDWQFTIEVLHVGKENKAEEVRLGLEADEITFLCPDGVVKFRLKGKRAD